MTELFKMGCRLKVFVFLILFVQGCVTTTDSSLTKKENKSVALDNYVQLGLAYIKRGDYERAKKHLLRALSIEEDSVGALSAMGLVYQKEGESVLAEEYFLKSLDINPKFTLGRTYYGAYLYAERRYQESYDQFKLASEDTNFPTRYQIFLNMAQCAIQLDNKEDAILLYERSLKLNREQPQIVLAMVGLLVDTSDYQKAQRYFNGFLGMIRASKVTHTSVSLYYGILLARHYSDSQLQSSYAMLLENLYPDSTEFQKYRQLTAND